MTRVIRPASAVLLAASVVSSLAWAQSTAQFPSDLPPINALTAAPATNARPTTPPLVAPLPQYPTYMPYYAPQMLRPMPYAYGYPMPYPQPYPQYNPYLPQGGSYPARMAQATQPYYASPYNPALPATPGPKTKPAQPKQVKKPAKAWGDTRHIWPDFYTSMTDTMWDKMINAPYDMGRMPGGWRFPSLSVPDPVTVGDAVANQLPPIAEEVPNFMNFTR